MLVLLSLVALAVPPDVTLTGSDGTLAWTVTEREDTLRLHGQTDRWDLRHTSTPELKPIRTVRTDHRGEIVALEYREGGVDVRVGPEQKKIDADDLWDGGSLPIRLGAEVAEGRTEHDLRIVDFGGRLRSVTVRKVADEACGEAACVHLQVKGKSVAGDYWFGADGALLRSENGAGDFTSY